MLCLTFSESFSCNYHGKHLWHVLRSVGLDCNFLDIPRSSMIEQDKSSASIPLAAVRPAH